MFVFAAKAKAPGGPVSTTQTQTTRYKYFLALSALGVVYGDIGTSPLYVLKESFHSGHHLLVLPENVLSLLSLIFWCLTIVISIKYLTFILKADNHGEGGILALTAMITPALNPLKPILSRSKNGLILLGLFGTALLYGDGMITPAISILSAVEGLSLITPIFNPFIIPITIGILIGLFAFQKKGTGTVGKIFGPVTLVWFIVIGALGLNSILTTPGVLKALNPYYVYLFFQNNSWQGFAVLGSVFLVVTGGEALYSDLGHFGRAPIQQAWFFVALPALVLNYFGQGALLLRNPENISNPFYLLAPSWALYPLVLLAAVATTIASQALITGVFSLTLQAVQNGYLPRLHIKHTSKDQIGQVYVKNMNRFLMVGSIALVLAFKSSSALASAYGLAVTTTMVITTILFYIVAREKWGWSRSTAGLLCGLFLTIDLTFWSASLLKIVDGGWFPLLVGIAGFTLMTTWKTGHRLLSHRLHEKIPPLKEFLLHLNNENITRIDGTAIFLNRSQTATPIALVNIFEHFKAVHRHLVFLSVLTESVPHISLDRRCQTEQITKGVYQVTLKYGYLESHHVPADIAGLDLQEFKIDLDKVSFIIGKESLYATDYPGMAIWREKIFSLVYKNEISATDYFNLPKERVIGIGAQIAI